MRRRSRRDARRSVLRRCQHDVRVLEGEGSDDEEGEDLCDCDFSLAYGGRILLSGAKLRLKKGGRYGLCGPNGAGKTTLMKAIANGQVDGFPDRDEVLTVYVAHDIQAQEDDPLVVDYLASDPLIKQKGLGAEKCRAALEEIGFDASRLALTISTLSGARRLCRVATGALGSRTAGLGGLWRRRLGPRGCARAGGWKMKLALARAMLLEAGLLLLDEPTNHMDTRNVAWLQEYLLTCGITLITVSHDSGFLDTVCTGIIHYESKKLVKYKGNLSAFVAQKPEARAYYELTNEYQSFAFPLPGPLDGVKCAPALPPSALPLGEATHSWGARPPAPTLHGGHTPHCARRSREKPVIKCKKMTFQYPGADTPQLRGVSLKANMAARVAITGPNGAGKSTLIRVITGEAKPTAGEIERHPNLRIAYIAQHAFHHLESHLTATPVQYIIRRYEHGEDEEEAEKVRAFCLFSGVSSCFFLFCVGPMVRDWSALPRTRLSRACDAGKARGRAGRAGHCSEAPSEMRARGFRCSAR